MSIIMKCQADKKWLKTPLKQKNESSQDELSTFFAGGVFVAWIIVLALTANIAEAAECQECYNYYDYLISPEMYKYLESEGITTADLEDLTRDELDEFASE